MMDLYNALKFITMQFFIQKILTFNLVVPVLKSVSIHVSSVYQTHSCMQAPIPTLCIPAKNTHNKGSRTRPIMSALMPRSGIPVICNRATLSCDSSYCICENKDVEAEHHLCFRYTDSTLSLFFLNPKFQASNNLLWLYSPVCIRPGQKPRKPVFSQRGSYMNNKDAGQPVHLQSDQHHCLLDSIMSLVCEVSLYSGAG